MGKVPPPTTCVPEQAQPVGGRFRAIFDHAPVGFKQVSADGRIVDVNPAMCSLVGYAREELLGRHYAELTHPDDRASEREHVEALMQSRIDRYDLEKRYVRADGSPVWVRLTGSVIPDEDGKPLFRVAVVLDVMERKAQEEWLARSRRRLELLAWAVGRLVTDETLETFLSELYEKAADELGLDVFLHYRLLPDGESLELRASGGISPAGVNELRRLRMGQAVCGRVAETRTSATVEGRQMADDPSARLVKAIGLKAYTCHPLSAGGKLLGTLSFGSRTHERFDPESVQLISALADHLAAAIDKYESHEEARRNEARFRTIFENAAVGVALVGRDRKWMQVNTRVCEIAGRPCDQLIGEPFDRVCHPDDAPREVAETLRLLRGEISRYALDKRFVRPDGTIRWAHVASSVVRSTRGDAEYVISIIEDITPAKELERELAGYRKHLEDLVEARTAALNRSTEQLRQAERLASLGTLASGIAHEINNPLNSILLAAEYAMRSEAPAQVREALQMIAQEAQRGGQVVRSVLKFAKNENTPKERGDLNDVLRSAADLTKLYTRTPEPVQLELADDLPPVVLNATELTQVFVNLLRNAVEACGAPAGVRARTWADDGQVFVSIEDKGPGIPPEVMRHIFDPFFSTKRQAGGTGLGLSIVHGIVRDHGGNIRVHSKPGEGAAFTIELPAAGTNN